MEFPPSEGRGFSRRIEGAWASRRYRLFLMFLGFFSLNCVLVLAMHGMKYVGYETMLLLFTTILGVYSVHLGVILGGIFGTQPMASQAAEVVRPHGNLAYNVAWAASLAWNILVVTGIVSFWFQDQTLATKLKAYLESIPQSSAFLVTGSLAYFFVDRESQRTPQSVPAEGPAPV